MWDELGRLAQVESLTVLLTTHYLEEADKLADRLAIVSRGRIVAHGSWRFNPVQWGVSAAREVVMPDPSWGVAFGYLGLLLAATAATSAFATWAFRAYRRTL